MLYFLFSIQFSCTILLITVASMVSFKTTWILIRWLRQEPANLDLQCFHNRIYPGTAELQWLNTELTFFLTHLAYIANAKKSCYMKQQSHSIESAR